MYAAENIHKNNIFPKKYHVFMCYHGYVNVLLDTQDKLKW